LPKDKIVKKDSVNDDDDNCSWVSENEEGDDWEDIADQEHEMCEKKEKKHEKDDLACKRKVYKLRRAQVMESGEL